MIQAGSRPVSRRTYAIIAAVVVLPWAPPTTIDGCAATSSARNAARGVPSIRCSVSRRDDDLPAGGRRRLAAEIDVDALERAHEDRVTRRPSPAPRRRGRVRCSRRPRSPTRRCRRSRAGARRAAASAAGKLDQPLGDPVRRVDPGHRRASPPSSRPSRSRSASSSSTSPGTRSISAFGTTIAPPPALEVPGVERLVVGGRVRVRNEDRRCPRRSQLPDGSAGAGDGDVGCREHVAEVVGLRHEDVVEAGARGSGAQGSHARRIRGRRQDLHRPRLRRPSRSATSHPRARRRRRRRARRARSRDAPCASSRLAPRWATGTGRPTTSTFLPPCPGIS